MLPRVNTTQSYEELDHNIYNPIEKLLEETYAQHCEKENKSFNVSIFKYPDELLFTVSYVSQDINLAPHTLLLSAKADTKIKNFIDITGFYFDQYFADPNQDYGQDWLELEDPFKEIYYRATRENIDLLKEANKLLED